MPCHPHIFYFHRDRRGKKYAQGLRRDPDAVIVKRRMVFLLQNDADGTLMIGRKFTSVLDDIEKVPLINIRCP